MGTVFDSSKENDKLIEMLKAKMAYQGMGKVCHLCTFFKSTNSEFHDRGPWCMHNRAVPFPVESGGTCDFWSRNEEIVRV